MAGKKFFNIFEHMKFKSKTVNSVIGCVLSLVKEELPVTASKVQKRLGISYYSAHVILERLSDEGVLKKHDLGAKIVYRLKSAKDLEKYKLQDC